MHPLADITGGNATVPIPTPVSTKALLLVVTGSGVVRVGDSTTTASVGLPIISAMGIVTLPVRGKAEWYAAGSIYVYIPTGTTLSVAYFN